MQRALWCLVLAAADLPVHCLRHELTGRWEFSLSAPSAVRSDCGHAHPDAARQQPTLSALEVASRLTVELREPAVATLSGDRAGEGQWTMVYDEGFEVRFGSLSFFAFSLFQVADNWDPDSTSTISICNATQVGWYANEETNEYGCFRGSQLDPKPALASMRTALAPLAALQGEPDHAATVRAINARATTWEAKAYDRYVGKSFAQLNRMAGLRRPYGVPREPAARSFLQRTGTVPDTLDWRSVNGESYLDQVIDQGDCGSCYVIATMRMLSARHRLASENPAAEPFSVAYPLHCSEYNQGCGGGYPFLVSKWSHDDVLVPESCAPMSSGSCRSDCRSSSQHRVQAFSYLGGYYGAGAADERAMLEELQNGPMVVSFEPGEDFMYYSKGVYKSTPVPHSEWTKVDHSVLLVGYGVEAAGQKYWIVQNSWGPEWGEGGFFRIARGDNDSGIEAEPIIGSVSA